MNIKRGRIGRKEILVTIVTTVTIVTIVYSLLSITPVQASHDWSGQIPDDWRRIWPSGAPSDYCRTGWPDADKKPNYGIGSGTYLNYGGSGGWKTYQVEAGVPLKIAITTDHSAITSPDFTIYDWINGSWKKVMQESHGYDPGAEIVRSYTPEGNKLKVSGGSFYVRIFQKRTETLPGEAVAGFSSNVPKLWRVHGGVLERLTSPSRKEIFIPDVEVKDFTLETRIKMKGGLRIAWRDDYYFSIDGYKSPTDLDWGIREGKNLGSKEFSWPPEDWGEWHKYRIEADGNHFEIYIDSEKVFSENDSEISKAGRIGILPGRGILIDEITVKNLEGNILFSRDFESIKPAQYSLSTEVGSGSGLVALDPSGGTYDEDTKVTVTAEPASGYEFDHWVGDYPAGERESESITATMDSDKSLTAYFASKKTLELTDNSFVNSTPSDLWRILESIRAYQVQINGDFKAEFNRPEMIEKAELELELKYFRFPVGGELARSQKTYTETKHPVLEKNGEEFSHEIREGTLTPAGPLAFLMSIASGSPEPSIDMPPGKEIVPMIGTEKIYEYAEITKIEVTTTSGEELEFPVGRKIKTAHERATEPQVVNPSDAVTMASCATLLVKTSEGRLGSTGEKTFEEIEGFYNGANENIQLIVIPSPNNEDYEVQAHGEENGEYDLFVGRVKGGNYEDIVTKEDIITTAGESDTYEVSGYEEETPTNLPLIWVGLGIGILTAVIVAYLAKRKL